MHSYLHSVAGCSSWFYHAPTRTLFDCGEGVSEHLKNHVFAIENICISHSHWDHVGGLIGLIFSRQKNRGDNDKPLNIYFPKNIEFIIHQMMDIIYNPSFEINLIPLDGQSGVAFKRKEREIQYFRTFHNKHVSYGYAIVENRKRLNAFGLETLAKDKDGFGKVVNDSHYEQYRATDIVYLLDSYELGDYSYLKDARLVIFDATFVKDADRDKTALSHMSWSMVQEVVKKYNVKKFILAHLSPRYSRDQIADEAKRMFPNSEAIICYDNIELPNII